MLAVPVRAESTVPRHGYTSFGIPLASSLEFPGAWRPSAPRSDATFVAAGELPPWSGPIESGWQGLLDGEIFDVIRSPTGAHRFLHGDQELFHLSPDHRTLTSAPVAARDSRWWRVLLDSVLFTVSLLRGHDALHAGAVVTPSGAVAIVARSGAGKSTLLAQLLSDGHELVTDDVLFLEPEGDHVLAHPGPPLMTLPRERADGVGTPLRDLGDEVWTAVPVVARPIPLSRLVLLDRRTSVPTAICRVEKPLGPLMTHLLRFPRTRERELGRFSLASAVATRAEIWHLIADVQVPPHQLAALVLRGLPT
jgi:hypothetical protein